MATLTRQSIAIAGTAITFDDATTGGDKAAPAEGVKLWIKNDGAVPVTLTLVTPGTVEGLAIADQTVTVAAGAIKAVPLLPRLYANKADSGLAAWTYSVTPTDVGVAAVI